MSLTALLFIAVITLWSLAWTGASLWLWTLTAFSLTYAFLTLTAASTGGWLAAAVVLGFLVLLNLSTLRTKLLTSAMFHLFKRVVPPLSVGERTNLRFGDLWWEGELFRGRPDWNKLLTFQRTRLTDNELSLLSEAVPILCEAVKLGEDAGWTKAKELGFLGLGVSKHYGGLGMSFAAQTRVLSKVASAAPGFAHDLGRLQRVPEWIAEYGTPLQKQQWLAGVVSGDLMISSAIPAKLGWHSEGCIAKAAVRPAGDDGQLTLRLDFPEHHVRLAERCSLIAIPVEINDPDALMESQGAHGTAIVMIPRDTSGLDIFPSQNMIKGSNVVISVDAIIGGNEMIGASSALRFEESVRNRGVSTASLTSGIGKRGYIVASAYASVAAGRGHELAYTEAAQASLAQAATTAYRLEAYRALIGSATDVSSPVLISSVIKLLSVTDAQAHLSATASILPRGMPLMSEHYKQLSALFRADDSLARMAYSDLFSQLAFRAHPFLLPSMDALSDNNLPLFDKLLAGYSGYAINRTVRAFTLAMTAGWLASRPLKGPVASRMRQLTRMSAALASVSDISVVLLGSELRSTRRQTARLGEVLCQLTSASAVIKYWYEQGQPKLDEPYVLWCIDQNLWLIQQAFDGYFDNYPSSVASRVMRRIVFPVGPSYRQPSDLLEREIASSFCQPNALRDRFSEGVSMAGQEPQFAVLEEAYLAAMDCRTLLDQFDSDGDFDLQLAALMNDHTLDDETIELLQRFDRLRKQIISVQL